MFLKLFNITILSMFIVGCASMDSMDEPSIGNYFFASVMADRLANGEVNRTTSTYYYRRIGVYPQGILYAKSAPIGKFKGAIFVVNDKIVKVISSDELAELLDTQKIIEINKIEIARQQKLIQEGKLKIESENQLKVEREKKIIEENNKYGTSGLGLFVENISKECLVRDGWTCKISGSDYQINASIRNNLNKEVKDIEIKCKYISQSGTELTGLFTRNRETIYQKWKPNEIRNFSFKVGSVEQTVNLKCEISQWK